MIESRFLLKAIYCLMNVTSQLEVEYTKEPDLSWTAELLPDGKVIDKSELGCGLTKEEALNDACERFFNMTPTIDQVPLPTLLKLISGDRELIESLLKQSD